MSLALRSLLEAGLVREVAHGGDGPSYGATFFEPVAEAALVLGLDLGGRFLRGAICDLRGDLRARQDVELGGVNAAGAVELIGRLRDSLVAAARLDPGLIDGAVVGVPGVVARDSDTIALATVAGLEGHGFGAAVSERLGLPVTLDNDVNFAALGEQWHGVARGVESFAFVSIGTGLGAGLVLHGELHRGQHGAAGEVDYALGGAAGDVDPCASAIAALVARLAAERSTRRR